MGDARQVMPFAILDARTRSPSNALRNAACAARGLVPLANSVRDVCLCPRNKLICANLNPKTRAKNSTNSPSHACAGQMTSTKTHDALIFVTACVAARCEISKSICVAPPAPAMMHGGGGASSPIPSPALAP